MTRSIIDASQLPSPLPPHIQAPYYGAIIASEAVGRTGSSRIVELDIDDDTLSGYAIFEGSKVKRVVLIDSEAFLSEDNVRGGRNVTLSFGDGSVGEKVGVKRLVIG